jgi:predicted nucleic acid-binding protein
LILVDTSVWVDHLGTTPDEILTALMARNEVVIHPFVIGELAMGGMRRRNLVLGELQKLPTLVVAAHREVMYLVDEHRLFGTGIGYIDAHLIASARLTPQTLLWTRDRRLHHEADRLEVAARLTH